MRVRTLALLALCLVGLALGACRSRCTDTWGDYEACNLLDGPCDCR